MGLCLRLNPGLSLWNASAVVQWKLALHHCQVADGLLQLRGQFGTGVIGQTMLALRYSDIARAIEVPQWVRTIGRLSC
jgi:hypothetical protein